MNNINQLEIKRLKPKVFCIGLNKTGTTSFGRAMTLFGYNTLGWNGGNSSRLINEYFKGSKKSLLEAAYDYDVLEDIPWPLYYEELEKHFPNAKFILTVRKSPEIWLKSITDHIISDYIGHKYIYGYFKPKGNEQAYLDKYNTHNKSVIEYFDDKPGKLLEMCFENGDGWSELLPFLGISGIPKTAWPHVNKAGTQPNR